MREGYSISSKYGTSREVPDAVITDLDDGAGKLFAWDKLGSFLYLTNLTANQAEDIPKKHDFILLVNRPTTDEEYGGSQ